MSYTNVIANTRTQSHSIVPEAKETTALERITQAQGTGRTGSAIRKVAQFIGMDAPAAPAAPEQLHVKGSLSVDFELERQQWRSSHKYTSALEEAERSARMKDTTTEGARKNRAFVFSKSILQKIQAPIHWTPRDYPASRKFLKYTRDNTTVIEELERLRRKNDTAGESTKRLLARQTSTAIFSDLQNPTLIPVSLGVHPGANLTGKLGEASEIAMKKLLPMAEHFAASAYQIGTFAARAAYFFGGKAAVTAQDLGAKAAVQGQVIGSQALAKGQDLGVKAAVTAQDLGHKAIEEAQYLGGQAIAGAQTLSHTAQQTALNTAATAQNVAHQTIEKTKSLTHQASAAASNAVATVQNMGGQAVEKVKDLAETAMEGSAAELSWNQLDALEEKERSSRIAAQFGSNRFTNALRTSSLIRDEIYAQKGTDENRSGSWYGTFILEETERLRRIVSDKSSPVARINAKRAAAIITLYRNQWSNQTAAQVVPIPQQFVKEVQVQQLAPARSYQAAM